MSTADNFRPAKALSYLFLQMCPDVRVINIEFKPFYSIFVKDMLTMSFNFISAVAEVKDGMTKTRKIDHFHFSFFHFFF